jgi:hypothetical protein
VVPKQYSHGLAVPVAPEAAEALLEFAEAAANGDVPAVIDFLRSNSEAFIRFGLRRIFTYGPRNTDATVLHLAARNGRTEVARILLELVREHGWREILTPRADGATALQLAAANFHVETYHLLMSYVRIFPSLLQLNNAGNGLLYAAAEYAETPEECEMLRVLFEEARLRPDLAEQILAPHPDVANGQAQFFATVLGVAVLRGRANATRTLLDLYRDHATENPELAAYLLPVRATHRARILYYAIFGQRAEAIDALLGSELRDAFIARPLVTLAALGQIQDQEALLKLFYRLLVYVPEWAEFVQANMPALLARIGAERLALQQAMFHRDLTQLIQRYEIAAQFDADFFRRRLERIADFNPYLWRVFAAQLTAQLALPEVAARPEVVQMLNVAIRAIHDRINRVTTLQERAVLALVDNPRVHAEPALNFDLDAVAPAVRLGAPTLAVLLALLTQRHLASTPK